MSPRISGVTFVAADFCAGEAACDAREASRKLLSACVVCAPAAKACAPAMLIAINQSLEYTASLLEQQSAALVRTFMPYPNACS
jgi:hypothetical protein